MPELRTDPILGERVMLAPERAGRPLEFAEPPPLRSSDPCPFCFGHEHLTPGAVLVSRRGNQPGRWDVRVVPNQFPILSPAAATRSTGTPAESVVEVTGRFESAPVAGWHEVIIEHPDHVQHWHELPVEQVRRVLEVWRERLRTLRSEPGVAAVLIFHNEGAAAGASMAHVHSQIVALPFVPPRLAAKRDAALSRVSGAARTPWQHVLNAELADGSRIVRQSRATVALCPFASRFAGEVWIGPLEPRPCFEDAADDELDDLADVLSDVLSRIDQSLGRPAFNMALSTAPVGEPRSAAFHWHLEITPRTSGIGGFELGTGTWINPLLPEIAASRLRGVRSPAD